LTELNVRAHRLAILSAGSDADAPASGARGGETMDSTRLLIATVACALSSLAATAVAQPKADLGKREYDGKCAVCHGKDGKGGGPYAELLKRPLPDLTTLAKRNNGVFPVSRTYEVIEGAGPGHGTREMPVWGMDYSVQAVEQLPDLPYNQAMFVRTRIMALLEYLNQIQVK
jgi:mono/diheme cytochrome c family protein